MLIDAILGSGTKSNLKNHIKKTVTAINESKTPCLCIDTPTGINTDEAINAKYTITFGYPKKIFIKKHKFCGKIYLVDIGIMDKENNKNNNIFKTNSILKLEYKND